MKSIAKRAIKNAVENAAKDNLMESNQQINNLKRATVLLDTALELDGEAREKWLQELVTKEPDVGVQVEKLLAANARASEMAFLDQTITPALLDIPTEDDRLLAKVPIKMGPYRLIRQIGEGGMSTVWLAERVYESFTRQVAIKRLPAFLKNDEHERRLLREASILASLDHPNIARLLDAGFSEDGDPYIALELIDGEPITVYCDRLRLDVRSRVALMVKVCEAVAFLHQHSVIHRDIKPSNVLVDKTGKVKLLDFGIAKLVDDALVLGDATRSSCNAFTPEYAAPEQINGKTVTTATDVYSLGVLLYRVLTGTRPYARTAPSLLIASAIVNTLPSRPSTLFGPTGGMPSAELMQIAEARQSSVRQLYASFRNDLDNILLKTLEKEIARRYATVDAFLADLNAWLDSRPVQAQRASPIYVMRKFAARHRGGVAASLLAATGLIAALGFGAWQARQTQLEVTKTKRVLTFLQTLIAEANPNNTGVQTITVLDLLQRAPDVAKKQFPEDANLQYEVLKPVERILRDLEAAEALEPVEREMVKLLSSIDKPPPEESAEILREYAMTLAYLGKRDEAETTMRKALQLLEMSGKKESVAHAETMLAYAQLLSFRRAYDQAVPMVMENFTWLTKAFSRDDPQLTKAAFHTIELLLETGRFTEAAHIGEKYFTLADIAAMPTINERQRFRVLHAGLRWYLGNPKAAAVAYEKLLEETKIFAGGNDVMYPQLLVLAARVAIDTAQYKKALQLLSDALNIENRAKSPDYRTQVNILSFATIANLNLGLTEAADETLAQASLIIKSASVVSGVYWQARFQKELLANNVEQAKLALDQQVTTLGARETANPLVLSNIEIEYANLARLSAGSIKSTDSLERSKAAVEVLRKRMPVQHYRLARAEVRLAQQVALFGTSEEALLLVENAIPKIESAVGIDHPLALQASFFQGQLEQYLAKPAGVARATNAAQAYKALLNRSIDPQLTLLH